MKSLFHLRYRLSFLIIFILAISCKKDSYVDEENELVFPVNFTFINFKNSSSYLKNAASEHWLYASAHIPANYSEGFLYFWSFNNETLIPDIKYSKSANPSITYNDGKSITWGAGMAFEGYAAGRASNFVGPQQIFIKLPIKDVLSISRFGFDMTGSATGPKDFELFYSLNEGDSYIELALKNQFGSPSGKNSFTYNLEELKLSGDEIWFKINAKAGLRDGVSAYNESTGTIRIDNMHLVGIAPTAKDELAIRKLHYFLFHKDKPELIFDGETEDVESMSLQLNLPAGDYNVFFILNNSNKELLLPNVISKSSDLYASNLFSNKEAEIFGYAGSISVSSDMTSTIFLQRLYSQIKIEFTDNIDLSRIKKLVFKQEHQPFFYSPFAIGLSNPILDQSSIEIVDDFQLNKQVVFNQFLGLLTSAQSIHYVAEVYSENDIIRTFHLQGSLKNNIQLVFRGNLLQEQQFNVGFQMTKNENWDGNSEVGF